ncbi:MAG TPA: M1 family metallopeptidase [Terracidiphilus sp.]|nr:M1 family metallopeptidase [Terracidiphilus sp.]
MKNPTRIPSLRTACLIAAVTYLALSSARPLKAERLSTSVYPTHYALTLAPDLKTAAFTGVETIDVVLKAPSNSITVNSAELTYQSVTITADGKTQTATVALHPDKEQVTFTVPSELAAGNATLSIHYTGILNDKLRGFYLSKGDHRNYAVTQFESTDARRAFPSFDEPAFKASFSIHLIVDKGDTAISNGPITKDTPGPGPHKHTLTFLTTPRMSSYLVAFLVGDFKCSSGSADGTPIRVCATPDKVHLTPYALSVAEFVLHYYDNYFGIHYPMKKLDLIAIPDFEAGAMENFGAITYRETDLLLDPATATVSAKKNVALVVAHEMAHQWFGDLVTMQWWNNIWLNEGFATWMESKAVAAMHPEWHVAQDVAESEDNTLNLDAEPTTRAIRAPANTRDEIEQMFDGISYGKGSDVLLTVENYLGPEVFRQGVHRYLEAHLYGNATAQDFWNAETAVSHKPVDKIMESLVAQPGVPLLTFGTPKDGMVSVSQRRFFLSPSIQPDPAQKWTLPICFKTEKGGQDCEVLTPTTTELKLPAGALFFADARGKGYYRSAYPPSAYNHLVAHVETGLAPAERIKFIGDEWAQVRVNKASVGDYLNLVAAVRSDPSAAVLDSAIGGVTAIYDRVAASPKEKAVLAGWVRDNFAPAYAKLAEPAPTDSPDIRELRATLFSLLGEYGEDPSVLKQARELAEKYLANPASVEPTLGLAALSLAARHGDAQLFDQLQKTYETPSTPDVQERALRLLAYFENPQLAERAFHFAVSGKVRNQDSAIQLAIALRGDKTRDLAWQFIRTNWDKVQTELTPEMGQILVGSTGSFCSDSARDQVEQFFAAHKVGVATVALRHAVERINGCVEFRALQQPKLQSWIASKPALQTGT